MHLYGSFIDSNNRQHSFDDITYRQYYVLFHLEKFTSDKTDNITCYVENANASGLPIMLVIRHTSKVPHITRIHPMSPSQGEPFLSAHCC